MTRFTVYVVQAEESGPGKGQLVSGYLDTNGELTQNVKHAARMLFAEAAEAAEACDEGGWQLVQARFDQVD